MSATEWIGRLFGCDSRSRDAVVDGWRDRGAIGTYPHHLASARPAPAAFSIAFDRARDCLRARRSAGARAAQARPFA